MDYKNCKTYKEIIQAFCENCGFTIEEDKGLFYIKEGLRKERGFEWRRLSDVWPKFKHIYVYNNELAAWKKCIEIVTADII